MNSGVDYNNGEDHSASPSPVGNGRGEASPYHSLPKVGEGQGGARGRGEASPYHSLPWVGEGQGGAFSAWAVDAGCSGNPGPMEYQGVDLATGEKVFHFGPYYADGSTVYGTNNIGEFLAIVHALALMDKMGITDKAIYSDSYNAILWVKKKQCKTKLERNERTEPLYALINRAEKWLRTHNVTIPIIQWQTRQWGDIPADFGRK